MRNTLLESGANPNIKDNDGRTPLHYAVSDKHEAKITSLLKHKAKLDIQDKDGKTPLHYAVDTTYDSKGNMCLPKIELIKMLLEEGATPNIKDNRNKTPSGIAYYNEQIKQLLNKYELNYTIKESTIKVTATHEGMFHHPGMNLNEKDS